MDRVDRHYVNQRWTRQDFGDTMPSEVFREHALACFISDPTSLKLYHDIGIDIIAFETDYPHSDSLWPDAPESLLAQCDWARVCPTTRSTRSRGRTSRDSAATTLSP